MTNHPHNHGMRLLLLWCCAAALLAVEVRSTVGRIADGDTLTVRAVPGLPPAAKRDRSGDVYVRLLCVDTLEIWDQDRPQAPEGIAARDALAGRAPRGAVVTLLDAGTELKLDQFGRALAFLRVGDDPLTVQEHLIAGGWSAYWRRWRTAPEPLHRRLVQAQRAARTGQRGAWATQPALMERRAAEEPR